ncbi:MAG: carboxymuconolactone decarboxylase family protein [Candidatus Acidiferrales bacterium]|jgi:AhpD family alkylhydroperoxidase
MNPRISLTKINPNAYAAVLAMQKYVDESGLERLLLELIKLRASQINGCAYCLDMHTKDARAMGETEQRLFTLSAWRETPFFTERERAALALTEAVTLVSIDHVPDDVYAHAHAQFNDDELMNLVMAIATINTWNRLAITFRAEPGHYQPLDRVKQRAASAQQK